MNYMLDKNVEYRQKFLLEKNVGPYERIHSHVFHGGVIDYAKFSCPVAERMTGSEALWCGPSIGTGTSRRASPTGSSMTAGSCGRATALCTSTESCTSPPATTCARP